MQAWCAMFENHLKTFSNVAISLIRTSYFINGIQTICKKYVVVIEILKYSQDNNHFISQRPNGSSQFVRQNAVHSLYIIALLWRFVWTVAYNTSSNKLKYYSCLHHRHGLWWIEVSSSVFSIKIESRQILIGMLNYLSQYIPDMSSVTAPMRSLLKADVPFVWNTEHAFNKVKEILSTTPGLRLFDPDMKVQIQFDAYKTGIGACLLEEGQPVAYYSKALTPTEMNLFPIEKECLAVVCAAEKFQHYIYGREVEVRSGHKPLEMITRKSIHNASPRI